MLDRIKNMPHSLVKKLEGVENLAVYVVEDFNLKLLKNMVEFGLDVFGEDMSADEWSLVPQIRHGNVYVVTEVGKHHVVGIAMFMRDWEDIYKAYLFDYAVDEEYQGMGMGFEFLKIISADLKKQGFKRICLTVDGDNKPAIRLYRDKIGFESIEFAKDEYGKGHDRYIMELDIDEFLEENGTK